MFDGFLNIFPDADGGFFLIRRTEEKREVISSLIPSLKGKKVILVDPMIATGKTLLTAISILEEKKSQEIIVAAAIASKEGLKNIFETHPNIKLFIAREDPRLNKQGYIVPGDR